MKFLADECCDGSLVGELRARGHDVQYVCENAPRILDDAVLDWACREDRIVITEDKDFGQLVYQLRKPCRGVLLLRFDPHEYRVKVARTLATIDRLGDSLRDGFVVIDPRKHRRRPLEPLPHPQQQECTAP